MRVSRGFVNVTEQINYSTSRVHEVFCTVLNYGEDTVSISMVASIKQNSVL